MMTGLGTVGDHAYQRHEAEIDDDVRSMARERGRRTLVLTDDIFQADTQPAVLSKE